MKLKNLNLVIRQYPGLFAHKVVGVQPFGPTIIDTKINIVRKLKFNIKLDTTDSHFYTIEKVNNIVKLKINLPTSGPIGLAYVMRFKYDEK